MSHNIDIFIAKSNQVSIQPNPNYATHPLKHGLVAIIPKQTYDATHKLLKGVNHLAHITTGYYGGVGWQSATVWINGQVAYKGDSSQTSRPINHALSTLGIIADPNLDEFDTVGLGQYRSNEDFLATAAHGYMYVGDVNATTANTPQETIRFNIYNQVVAEITPEGVMKFKIEATDQNAHKFIRIIDQLLLDMGRKPLQSINVTADAEYTDCEKCSGTGVIPYETFEPGTMDFDKAWVKCNWCNNE